MDITRLSNFLKTTATFASFERWGPWTGADKPACTWYPGSPKTQLLGSHMGRWQYSVHPDTPTMIMIGWTINAPEIKCNEDYPHEHYSGLWRLETLEVHGSGLGPWVQPTLGDSHMYYVPHSHACVNRSLVLWVWGSMQERITLLSFCSYVQWVPDSDVIVAQVRPSDSWNSHT